MLTMGKLLMIIAASLQIYAIHSGNGHNQRQSSFDNINIKHIPRLIHIDKKRKLLYIDEPRGMPQEYYKKSRDNQAQQAWIKTERKLREKRLSNTVQLNYIRQTHPNLIDTYPKIVQFDDELVSYIREQELSDNKAIRDQAVKFSKFYDIFQQQLLDPKNEPRQSGLFSVWYQILSGDSPFLDDDKFIAELLKFGIIYQKNDRSRILHRVLSQMLGCDLNEVDTALQKIQIDNAFIALHRPERAKLRQDENAMQKFRAGAVRKIKSSAVKQVIENLRLALDQIDVQHQQQIQKRKEAKRRVRVRSTHDSATVDGLFGARHGDVRRKVLGSE